jgi:hypothetical protein
MLTSDEAISVGLRKYRELYPEGTIPADLEDKAGLGASPGARMVSVYVTFGIRGQREPFWLFKATVDRTTGETTVDIAADWHELTCMEFDNSQFPNP